MDLALHFPPPRRRLTWAGFAVLSVHAAALWALLQLDAMHQVLRQALDEVAPLMVSLVDAPTAAPPTTLPAPRPAALPSTTALAVPDIDLRSAPTNDAPQAPASEAALPAPRAAPPVAAAIAAPPPPAPQRLAASALRYLVEPAVQVPRLSRRARESGTVLLHVVVDVQGLPRSVTLRQSSGHPRLDEQAVAAMRAARFVPCTDNGRAVECEADAPIVYELES